MRIYDERSENRLEDQVNKRLIRRSNGSEYQETDKRISGSEYQEDQADQNQETDKRIKRIRITRDR
jgi:hypothetical protein